MGLGGPAGLVAHVVGCSPYADGDEQHEATQSLLDHIIKPLEQECHNTVDVVLTECSAPHGCPRLQQVFQQLGGRVVANRTACTIRDQGEGYRAALSLFKSRMRFASYEIVLVTRHDVVWSRSAVSGVGDLANRHPVLTRSHACLALVVPLAGQSRSGEVPISLASTFWEAASPAARTST
jgi:hypothetical protein